MDPAIDLAPTPGPGLTAQQLAVALGGAFAGTVGGLWLFESVQRTASGELIWPLPADVWTGVVFVTAFLVVLGAARILTRRDDPYAAPRRGTRADGLIAAPILLLIAISATARLGTQLVGFAGLRPLAVPVMFTVLDTENRQSRGGTHYYLLRLRHGDRGRTFSDEVRRSVYDAAHEGDTVALPVETGRFGLQRAMVGTPLRPADLHHPR